MTVHIPVLAGELVELLDPAPGEIAVDCTFGGGGHARLIAERIGPAGTLIGIDRDPEAQARFEEMAAEVACHTRFIRASFAEGLELLRDEGVRADMVYLDLGMSSMQVDTRERGFSYAYDAPLDMRMDPDQELTAREVVNTWEARQLARAFRDFGEERYAHADRALDRPRPPARDDQRPGRGDRQRRPGAGALRRRPSRPSASSRRCASSSTTSSSRSTRRFRWRGTCSSRMGDLQGFRSTRSKIAA